MTGSEPPEREQSGSASSSPVRPPPAPSFAVLQMNLCLSGLADCYAATAYPAGVRDAAARVRELEPDAVTVNEGCRRDVERIARTTGYHLSFAPIAYDGELLRCIDPGGRGLFGAAVLTRTPVTSSVHRAFTTQGDPDERRWLCVTTRTHQDVCTAHLSTRHSDAARAANDAQCVELAALLARRAAARPVAFGGDVNRWKSCAPAGIWTRTDAAAEQAPGVQHVYGSRDAFHSPRAVVLPTARSDHDMLLVRARPVR